MANTDEWTTISEERVDRTKVQFDTIGDQFIGVYDGNAEIPLKDGNFLTQYYFTDPKDGVKYFINGTYRLNAVMARAPKGKLVRITYIEDVDTGQKSPMRDFRLDAHR